MMSHSLATIEAPRSALRAHRGCADVFGPREFFEEFLRRLEEQAIPYAILHGYGEFPDRFPSDVDYAVQDADLPRIGPLLAALARQRGWEIVQVQRHELFATYCVAIDPENVANHLALDVCSHFAKHRCLMVRDTALLEGRQRHARGFFVPSAASEFIYLLAKAIAKDTPVAGVSARLRELWEVDPSGCGRRVEELIGESGWTVEDCLEDGFSGWEQLRATVRNRTGYGPRLLVSEAARRIRRALNPIGMHIAFLGPDGAGKSTLIRNLERLLAPCFSKQHVFKFRPDVFNRIVPGVDPTPHARAPRSRIVSWAKILYYFTDCWLGLFFRLLPIQRRGGLVVFDRNFDDIVVDQRRYLVQGVEFLARVLRPFVPRASATFILDAEPRAIHARKSELPIEELERQRGAFRRLAQGDSRMHLLSAEEPPGEVARKAARQVITLLARREERRARKATRRLFDLAVAALAAIILSPLLLVLALLVRLKLGSPVLFKQERPGLHGRTFSICKFRTMTDARDASGHLLPDAERLTRFGKLLRSTSLDELPELLNVLKGEMRLVGPRPLLMEYLPLYSAEQMRRHDVPPGVTGWAQVNGRNAVTWPRKFALDLWYVDHRSIWLDLRIIALTFSAVLRRHGINQPGHATGAKFRGESDQGARNVVADLPPRRTRRTPTTIVITGVGDTVGQALIKTARNSSLPCRVVGTDREESSVGLRWVDKGFVLPHCSQSEAYLDAIHRICTDEGVQLVLPGSEKELELLSRHSAELRSRTGAIVVASTPEVLGVAMDKWRTCRFLEKAGLNFPRYAKGDAADDIERLVEMVGFPLIAKPLHGTGARGLIRIEVWKDLEAIHARGADFVVQEYLMPDEQEYSVEVYTFKNGRQAGAISYRRVQLVAGDTYHAVVAPNEAAENEAKAVARALGSVGPCNVQLRVTDRGPVTFEINPRFSGGVAMRAHFGYNEVEMAIRDLVHDEPMAEPRISSGRALRFWEEMYIDDDAEAVAGMKPSACAIAAK